MIPTVAIILRTDDPLSIEYSKTAEESCKKVGLPSIFFEGINAKTYGDGVWKECGNRGIAVNNPKSRGGGAAATAGHFLIWKKIMDEQLCAIVLEHDSIMLHPVTCDIPHDVIVNLGYKVKDPENYNHLNAYQEVKGVQKIQPRNHHGGAHAYAITHITAKALLKVVHKSSNLGYIDNGWFLANRHRGDTRLGIIDPIPAIGWLRASTIWKESAVDNYAPILDSFNKNYKSKQSLNVKDKK